MPLIILNDPAGITGRQQRELDYSATLQANIERHLEAGGDCTLLINGVQVDPLTDRRMDLPPSRFDIVQVVRRPAGLDPATWIALASLALSVYAYATAPRPEDIPTATDSPNNRLTGQTNIARAYQAVPDVYGRCRVWPDLIQQSLIEYVDHVKFVTEWLCVSRGRGTLSEVKYADTPLSDINGASFQVFEPSEVGPISPGSPLNYPENQTTTLIDVYESFSAPDVNGQELGTATFPDPFDRSCELTLYGTTTFDLKMVNGPELATLKGLAPSGSARIVFPWLVADSPPQLQYFDEICTVVSYVVSGPDVTFTFTAPYSLTGFTPQTVFATLYAASTSSSGVGPFTLPQIGDQIWANIVFPRGLQGTVLVEAEWWEVDAAGVEIGGTREDNSASPFSFSDATYDPRFYTRKIVPAAGSGRYKIRFTRLTADLGNGADLCKLEGLFSVRYYATKDLPGVTVIRATTRATEAATGVRERKFNGIFERAVRTLSTAAITEASITASRNFARALTHQWCVAGNDLAELDTTAMAAINTAMGETSPLLRFDGTFDDADMSLGQRMQMIADTARCKVWRDGTKWTVTREQAMSGHVMQLDYRNLAAGGQSQITEDSFMPASFDGVEIEYTDENTLSTRAYVRLTIAGGSVAAGQSANPRRLRLVGCATAEQAENRAHLEARRLLYQRTKVSDTALADAGALGLLSLVRWVDPNDFAGDDGLQAGEVVAIAGSTITTSEPLDWKSETSGRMQFTGVNGLPLGAPVVVTPGADPYKAVLASVPSGLYVADGANAQSGSRYAFGVALTEAEMESAGLYVVERLAPGADRTVSVALANYDERMFGHDVEAVPDDRYVSDTGDAYVNQDGNFYTSV